jgi:hypothetical protein
MGFIAISSDNVLVAIVLQFLQGGCNVANESITWVIVIAFFEWCSFLLVPGGCHCAHRWGYRHGSLWWHRGWTCHWCRTLAIPIVLVCQLWLISTGSIPWSLWVELCLQVGTGLWRCGFHSSWQWLMLSCYLVMMWPCFKVGWWFGQITSSYVTSPLGQGLMVGAQCTVVGCWQGELEIRWQLHWYCWTWFNGIVCGLVAGAGR